MQDDSVQGVDGILLDLGVSSFQLDNADRGFSYHKDAPLDMRMSKSGLTAADIVASYSVSELTRIFRDYGEEKFAYKIALRIADEREKQPIVSTLQLSGYNRLRRTRKGTARRSPREKMLSGDKNCR